MSDVNEDKFRHLNAVLLAVAIWALGFVVVGLGAQELLPPVASRHGVGVDGLLRYLLAATGSLVLLGHLILGYFIFRFGRAEVASSETPSAKATRTWSIVPAVVMTVVAEGGVLVMGLPVLDQLNARVPDDAVVVEVTAEQFTWTMRYPGEDGAFGRTDPRLISFQNSIGLDPEDRASADDIQETALLYLPVNRTALIKLRSKDVIHSFYLPNHRIKQDAVPGMTIDVQFVPTVEGEFDIACAELCGFGHYQMRGFVRVVSERDFDAWLRDMSER